MAYPALKKFTYLGQFGVLAGFTGAGLVVGAVVSLVPFIGSLQGSDTQEIMDKLLVPENAGKLRLIQFISTFFIFFLPAFFYAKLCHRYAFRHLGYRQPVNFSQAGIVIIVMLASLPLVSSLSQLTELMPFSEATLQKFRDAEDEYMRQVEVIGRMNNFGDFLISLFMLAILPAVFEETLFRGGLQNLLSRWFRMPVLAIIITAVLFSVVHFSYIGFMSRVVLGFLLGWMYYRTGNLWLSIIAHATNNATALIVMYVMKLNNPDLNAMEADWEVPLWTGAISLLVIIGLLRIFDRLNKHQLDRPGQELVMETPADNPFA